jgi:hypothetical protein
MTFVIDMLYQGVFMLSQNPPLSEWDWLFIGEDEADKQELSNEFFLCPFPLYPGVLNFSSIYSDLDDVPF